MRMPRFVAGVSSVGLIVLGADVVSGQDYPNKPIRTFTSPAGGSSDIAGRIIMQAISSPLGQQMIIENRAGLIAAETVMRAPPDGYTLLFYSSGLWILPLLQSTPYDPVKDFLPITLAVSTPNILVVHPSLPVRTIKELIALAKARPGELNYASGPTGASNHLAAELFKAMADVNMVRVTYRGGGPANIALIGGEVQLMFTTAGSGGAYVKSGRLKALAVTSAQPSALAPGLPTVAASGLPGYESAGTSALFAPAKTSATIINRLNQEVVRALNGVDLREKLFNSGTEVVGNSPEELAAKIKSEMATSGKLIKDAGIRAE